MRNILYSLKKGFEIKGRALDQFFLKHHQIYAIMRKRHIIIICCFPVETVMPFISSAPKMKSRDQQELAKGPAFEAQRNFIQEMGAPVVKSVILKEVKKSPNPSTPCSIQNL